MITDYFEGKKIWLSSSPGHIGLALIGLLVTALCGLLGFIFVGVLFIALSGMYSSSGINDLLPFTGKERKTRFLTEVMMDLLFLSIPLIVNTVFIIIRHSKLELSSHPVYVVVCFLSFIIALAQFSINSYFGKDEDEGRSVEKCLADSSVSRSVKIYEAFIALFKVIIGIVLFDVFITIVTNGAFWNIAKLDDEICTVVCTAGILSGVILVIDMARTIGGRNEYIHTV
ncbi:hypothetical protein [Agathobacter sp.]